MSERARGLYPDRRGGWGGRGGTRYPTVVEAYNFDSDYKRWKLGMEYWFGNGKAWIDRELFLLARLRSGPVGGTSHLIATLFPSRTGPERAWHVTSRVRGSIILPAALTFAAVSFQMESPDWSEHRLVYDTRGVLNEAQLVAWTQLVGDQFEDSASGPSYPDDLIPRPVDAVALTLVEVDAINNRLIFDLSRPYVRITRGERIYWKAGTYDPADPLLWRLDGSRHLCSSPKFLCSCPDFQGRSVANLAGGDGSDSEDFPMPGAGRKVDSKWESDAAGYYSQWRTLDQRADRRRECKHIHATRWGHGVPFFEPSDYPIGGELAWVNEQALRERTYEFAEVLQYYEKQLIGYDRLLPAVADVIGLQLDPTGDLRGTEPSFRPESNPILWNDPAEPQYEWARQNDWWLKRGTNEVRAFSPADGGFSELIGGEKVFEVVQPGSVGAPVVVK